MLVWVSFRRIDLRAFAFHRKETLRENSRLDRRGRSKSSLSWKEESSVCIASDVNLKSCVWFVLADKEFIKLIYRWHSLRLPFTLSVPPFDVPPFPCPLFMATMRACWCFWWWCLLSLSTLLVCLDGWNGSFSFVFSLSLLKRTKLCTYFILSSLSLISFLPSMMHLSPSSSTSPTKLPNSITNQKPSLLLSFFPFFSMDICTLRMTAAMPCQSFSLLFLFYFLACAYSSMIHSFAAN